jgi:Protein of unknown function (DUF3631)
MSSTLTGEPQPKADGKASHPERRRVGDMVAPPIPDWGHPQDVFDYKDARGNLLYQNVRFPLVADGSPVLSSKKPDKTFRLRRPNGIGGWVDDLDEVARVPYRLPDLVKALVDGATVFIPEGEAKVDALLEWSVPATHIAAGTKDYAELFCEADVILMPDNDAAGWKHVNTVGAALHGIARRIRVLMLPGLPDKGDIIDWVAAGGTAEKLRELAEQAPAWMPHAAEALPEGDEKIDELARLSAIEYDRRRERAAKDLCVRVSVLDEEVKTYRTRLALKAEPPPLFPHWRVEAWPEAVAGNALIREIMRRLQRHVVLTPDQALTVALWIMMAWAHAGAAIYSPILMATSAEANSGKTTLLNLVGFLVPRSLSTVAATGAVLFRSIAKWSPTIIVDEADTMLVNNEPLRAVINSGWTRGSGVLRCDGDSNDPRLFSTFCPKAIGLKGRKMPDTTLSRCIIIDLKRKKRSDRVEHFRHLDDAGLADLRRQAQRWTRDNVATLETAVPQLPAGFDNRLGDNWRLMLAIADLAGGECADQARQAATAIARVVAADMSIGIKLLTDIKDIFAMTAVDRLPSLELVEALGEIEGHPWADWTGGKLITQNALAHLLEPFGIRPGSIRLEDNRVLRGYQLSHFQDAFERYMRP